MPHLSNQLVGTSRQKDESTLFATAASGFCCFLPTLVTDARYLSKQTRLHKRVLTALLNTCLQVAKSRDVLKESRASEAALKVDLARASKQLEQVGADTQPMPLHWLLLPPAIDEGDD